MTHFHTHIDIQAPPDRVWPILRDIEHWSDWKPSITSVRLSAPGPIAVGTRAVVSQPKLLPSLWQVTAVEEGRGFTWITRRPGVCVTARHCIEPLVNGSRVILSLDFDGSIGPRIARLTRNLNTRYLDLEARGLRKHAEGLTFKENSHGDHNDEETQVTRRPGSSR